MSLTTQPRPGLPRDCFSLVNWSKVPWLIISSRGGERVPFILLWLRLLGRHCAEANSLDADQKGTRRRTSSSETNRLLFLDPSRSTFGSGGARRKHFFTPTTSVSLMSSWVSSALLEFKVTPWIRSFPAKWLQFVISDVCPWWFSVWSLASPSLRPGHKWCPYPPCMFQRRAQGQAVSAGKFLGLSIFLRSQRSPPGPLFMWDRMLFHFPLVILLPWRELDSWYNYMLGQFPVKVTPDCHRLPPTDLHSSAKEHGAWPETQRHSLQNR